MSSPLPANEVSTGSCPSAGSCRCARAVGVPSAPGSCSDGVGLFQRRVNRGLTRRCGHAESPPFAAGRGGGVESPGGLRAAPGAASHPRRPARSRVPGAVAHLPAWPTRWLCSNCGFPRTGAGRAWGSGAPGVHGPSLPRASPRTRGPSVAQRTAVFAAGRSDRRATTEEARRSPHRRRSWTGP